MDTFRYILALLFVTLIPPMVFYWPVIHGFIGFWRRLGAWPTLLIVYGGVLVAAFGLYQLRHFLLQGDLGTNWALVALGAVCVLAGGWMRLWLHRTFSMGQLLGLEELSKTPAKGHLVRTGLYARMRHPRYVQFMLASLGWVLIANYPAAYLAWLTWIPGAYVTVLFEERELRQRFGQEYVDYCREVPRFVPRRRKA
ncbi:MAG: isoprenylcysteine carboxylmethyltransferase family protein [SAR202 cluster bacterium]|nr:isoprenylcysteine carboxylmethyltransferase family protein [SAR202 cluster bacterium]